VKVVGVYLRQLLRELLSIGSWTLNAASLLVGVSVIAVLSFVARSPLVGAIVGLVALLALAAVGSFRMWKRAQAALDTQTAKLVVLETGMPSLRFGRPKLERRLRQLRAPGHGRGGGRGRVIQVPVFNEQGASEARHVHAVLYFNGKDSTDTLWYPLPAQGEWETVGGSPAVEVSLAGNGRFAMLNVVAIFAGDYPNAYEWTAASREAGLNDYAIMANCFDVEIEVKAAGPSRTVSSLRRTLRIDFHDGNLLLAEWKDSIERTNWVALDPGRC